MGEKRRRVKSPPIDATLEERCALLGERLGIPFPKTAPWVEKGSWAFEALLALAEQHSPEFRLFRPGRHPGAKTKKEKLNPNPTNDTNKKRRQRARQSQARAEARHKKLLEQLITSLEPFMSGRDKK